MKAVVAAFNQEKALVGAYSVKCEIFANLSLNFVSDSSAQPEPGSRPPGIFIVSELIINISADPISNLPRSARVAAVRSVGSC